MSKKRYPDEFKIEAVKQVMEAGYSAYDVAERLGTTTNSLYSWIRRYGPNASDFKQGIGGIGRDSALKEGAEAGNRRT